MLAASTLSGEQQLAEALKEKQFARAEQLLSGDLYSLRRQDSLGRYILSCRQAGRQGRRVGAHRWAIEQFSRGLPPRLWRQPANEVEWKELGRLYVDMAYTYEHKIEDFELTEEYCLKAAEVFSGQLRQEDIYVAKFIYRPLGNVYTRLGDFKSAALYLNKFKEICLREQDIAGAASAYSDLGIMYQTRLDFEAAANAYEAGLGLNGLDPVQQGLLQSNYATAYFMAGSLNEALDYTQQAGLSFQKGRGGQGLSYVDNYIAHNHYTLGEILMEKGASLAEVEGEFRKAEQLFLQLYPSGKARGLAKLYQSWAQLYLRKGDFERGIAFFQRSFNCVLPGFSFTSWRENPDPNDFFAENSILDGLAGKADALQDWYEAAGGEEKLKLALECHRLVFSVEQLLRQAYHYESSKLFNVAEARSRSAQGIRIALRLWQVTGEEKYKETALEFAEHTKSTLLLESFHKSRAEALANIPAPVLKEERRLQLDISLKEKDIYEYRAAGAPDSLLLKQEEELQALKLEYREWIAGLEQNYPDYYRLKYNVRTLTSSEIRRQLLGRDEAFIEYFVGPEEAYAFVITPDSFKVVTLEKGLPLDEWVAGLRENIAHFQFPTYNKEQLCASYRDYAYRLYDKLVRPLEGPGLPERLTIVPSGALGFLPFDALLTGPTEGCNFKEYPYLIHRYNISYGYSATLQAALQERPVGNHRFTGFAPAFDGSGGHSELAYNISLLEAVHGLVGGGLYTGREATVARLQEVAAGAGLLHFSSHAQANTSEGDFSFIVFSDGQGGYDSLFVKDVYLLPLRAEMAVLSACETSVGTLYNGEGIISLARGFLYAGANSVITTLWSINDEANSRLMAAYYRFLKKGHSKSQALRLAKLEQAEKSTRFQAHPAYWAAFTPIGNMRPVYYPQWVKLLTGAAALALLAGLLLGLRRIRSKKGRKEGLQLGMGKRTAGYSGAA